MHAVWLLKYTNSKRLPKLRGADSCTLAAMLKVDPTVNVPAFCAIDLSRLPPVEAEHVDVSAILAELSALRREVRMMSQLCDEVHQLKIILWKQAEQVILIGRCLWQRRHRPEPRHIFCIFGSRQQLQTSGISSPSLSQSQSLLLDLQQLISIWSQLSLLDVLTYLYRGCTLKLLIRSWWIQCIL